MSDRPSVGILSLGYAAGGGVVVSDAAVAHPLPVAVAVISFTTAGYLANEFVTGGGSDE